jgi:RIO kinase 1
MVIPYCLTRLLSGFGCINLQQRYSIQPQAYSLRLFYYPRTVNKSSKNITGFYMANTHWQEQFDDEELNLRNSKKPNRSNMKCSSQVNSTHKAIGNEFSVNDPQHQLIIKMKEKFTYQPSRYEESWLHSSLAEFYQNDWISNIDRMVKGGKEASVYLCQPGSHQKMEWVAAKVYRPRKFRNLRNDKLYREGREDLDENGNIIIDGGKLVAMRKKTNLGRQLLHQSWIQHEFSTMQLLHNAGCDLPQPLASGANGLLMEYIGERVSPAPLLQAIQLTPPEAREIAQRVFYNIELMLEHQRIHGDLSPYNILYWNQEIRLIDFPQAIHPDHNPQAYALFCRDIQKMDEYFNLYGFSMAGEEQADKLWKKFRFKQAEDFIYDLPDQLEE